MSEELAGSRWLRRASIDGGWVVHCRLCGKRSKRAFMAANTNYAEAERQSREYAHEHIASVGHKAALRAHQSEAPEASREEVLLNAIFGLAPLSNEERRRGVARNAAKVAEMKARSELDRARHQALREMQPTCAICGKPVSIKEDRAEERTELPSGAMIHVACLK